MKNNKKLTIALALTLAAVLGIAGIAMAVRATTSSTVMVLPVSSLNYGEMMDWENSVTGYVTADAEQNVYLSDTETVEEVLVTEGQAVHKDDVLLKYDTKSTRLKLEKEKINREKIELSIEVARQNLKTLEGISPESEDDDLGFDEDFDEFGDTEIYEEATVYTKILRADAKPVNDDPENLELGSEIDPYVFLCDGDSIIITKDFIKKWQKVAKKQKADHLYIAIEKRDKEYNLMKAWITDIMIMDPKYDVEIDLYTGEALYANVTDPAKMAKLLRTVLKEMPEDERGLWLAVVLDKLAILTEKEDKLEERGALLATAINELNTEDQEELAAVAAKLEGSALTTLLKGLDSSQIRDVDQEVIAGLFGNILENMSTEQIQAIDPEILGTFLNKLTADQLSELGPEKIGDILDSYTVEELKTVLGRLSDEKRQTILNILEQEEAAKEETAQEEAAKEETETEETTEDQSTSSGDKTSGGAGTDNSGSSGDSDSGAGTDDSGSSGDSDSGASTDNSESGDSEPADSGSEPADSGSEPADSKPADSESSNDSGDDSAAQDSQDSASEPVSEAASGSTTPSTAPDPEDESEDDADFEDDGGSGSAGGKNGSGLLSSDLSYTSKELEEAIREQKEQLKELELDLRESDIKIRQAERALESGVVKATMNGVVKYVGDPGSPPTDGSAFLTVAGAEGLYIKSGIKESLYGVLSVGDKITVVSWQSGGNYEAEIKSISAYPDTEGQFGDEGETYYPFTAGLTDPNAQLENGEWVEVTYKTNNSSVAGTSGNTLTIMKAFVREEENKKYVFIRDDNGKLKKQYIETGLLSDSGYEVLSGVTESDWIAFPYGKNVKEGARTYEGSYEDLYN